MSKYQEYTHYIDTAGLEDRVTEDRFLALDTAQKKQLVSIITTAKAEQLQALEARVKPLLEYSGIEPDVLKTLVDITLDVPEESRSLQTWQDLDKPLYTALKATNNEKYYSFCLNLRHEYLLNKEALLDEELGFSTLADKLLTRGHTQLTKYITGNPLGLEADDLALVQSVYPVGQLTTHATRQEPNRDFTLMPTEIEGAVRAYLPQIMQEMQAPALAAPEEERVIYSDAMSGDLSAEQYEAKRARVEAAQNQQLLVRAVKSNDITTARTLLEEKHVDPTKAKENGQDVLTIDSWRNPQMTELLWKSCPVDKKADILGKKDRMGDTLLHKVADLPYPAIVKAMLENQPQKKRAELISERNDYGRSPLSLTLSYNNTQLATAMIEGINLGFAAENGYTLIVKTILKRKTPKEQAELIAKEDVQGNSPLSLARNKNDEALVQTMLERIDLDLAAENGYAVIVKEKLRGNTPQERAERIAEKDEQGNSPLSLALKSGDQTIVKQMLEGISLYLAMPYPLIAETILKEKTPEERAALISKEDTQGNSPLSLALSNPNKKLVTAILEGISLGDAVENGYTLIVKTMLEGKTLEERAELITKEDEQGNSPLSLALKKDDKTLIRTMLKEIDLGFAAENGYPLIVKTILEDKTPRERAALIARKDQQGNSPLSEALTKNDQTIVKQMLDGISLDLAMPHPLIVETILKEKNPKEKAELISKKNEQGNSPLSLARSHMWYSPTQRKDIVNRMLEGISLGDAVKNGHTLIVETMLADKTPEEKAALIAKKDAQGNSPLSLALTNGNKTLVHKMLEGINLGLAAENGYTSIVETMLADKTPEEKAALIAKKDARGNSPLSLALRNSDKTTVKQMLDGISLDLAIHYPLIAETILKEKNPKERAELITKEDAQGNSPLSYARSFMWLYSNNTKDIMNLMLEGISLAFAAENGYTPIVETMLEGKTPKEKAELITKEDAQGNSPLSLALTNDDQTLVNTMLKGISLGLAAENGYAFIIETMLEGKTPKEKAELIATEDKQGNSPLSLALKNGHKTIAKEMLEGISLGLAAENGKALIVKTMLESKTPKEKAELITKEDEQGNSPLSLALKNGNKTIVKEMLEGIKLGFAAGNGYTLIAKTILETLQPEEKALTLERKDKNGYTYLHTAAKQGDSTFVKILLEHGANPTLRCNESSGKFITMIQRKGATPADLARDAGHLELANTLQNAKNEQQSRNGWAGHVSSSVGSSDRGM